MLSPSELLPGSWYVSILCNICQSRLFLFPDLNEGKSSLLADYLVTCPKCGLSGRYEGEHYFHPTGVMPRGDEKAPLAEKAIVELFKIETSLRPI